MHRLLFLAALALISSGCITQRGCERRFPVKTLRETIVERDTLIVRPEARVDTFVRIATDTLRQGDTVIVERDRLRLSIVQRHDTVYVAGQCLPDTVRVPQYIRQVEVGRSTWWQRFGWGVVAGFAGVVLARVVFGLLDRRHSSR